MLWLFQLFSFSYVRKEGLTGLNRKYPFGNQKVKKNSLVWSVAQCQSIMRAHKKIFLRMRPRRPCNSQSQTQSNMSKDILSKNMAPVNRLTCSI